MKNLSVIRRLLSYVARYKWRVVLLVLTALTGVFFTVAKPLPIKVVIDNVLIQDPLPGFIPEILGNPAFLQNRESLLIACIALIAGIAVGSALVSYLATLMTLAVGKRLVYDLSVDFYKKLQQLSLTFYSRNQAGDLLQRMNGDIFVVYIIIGQIVLPVITSVIALAGMFYVMSLIDQTLAMIALSVVPFLGISLILFSKPMNDSTMAQYKKQGQLSAFVQQSLSSMKMIQAFVRESFMYQKLETRAWDFGQAFQRANQISAGYNQLTNLITGIAGAILVGLGAYKGLNGNISAGDLYVFLGYITALYGPVNSLSTAIGAGIAIGARGRRVFEVIDSQEVVVEAPDAKPLQEVRGEVIFENVSFGYGPQETGAPAILKDINLQVSAGEIVAVIGPTGAGKTSLISLLTRFYDPWKGRILIDGQDLRNLQLHSLRENISLVLQDPFLFPMSIADNIAFGNPGASREEIIEAAKRSHAHEFVSRLQQGYDTPVSEAGASLSGGEKQRVSLARAFLKEAPILILDEPTSALDALTEAAIFRNLAEFTRGRTVFIISHRLSTIKHADKIITVKDGQIVENGDHASLMARGELYAELYKHQQLN